MKALCFGSMNIDYVYSLDHIVGPGETIFSTGRETFAGGKGLNQSVAMAKAGLPVWHAGICGTGGELLIDTLRENGVDTSLIRREDSPPGHTVIQVDARGQNCIIVYGGTNRRVTPEYIAEALSGFGEGDMVLLQNEVNRLGEIIDAAHARGMRVVLNPSPFDSAVLECDLDKVDLFLVNEIEGSQISGLPATEPEAILDWFASAHPKSAVILTLGADGAWYSDAAVRRYQSAVPTKAVDTTAAGDTFNAALARKLADGCSAGEAIVFANYASALAVSKPGAQDSVPSYEEVLTFKGSVE